MTNSDIFLSLTPRDRANWASSAFKLPHNSRWLRKAELRAVADRPLIGSRESTPAFEPELVHGSTSSEERLVVTFSELFKHRKDNNVYLGTDPRTCHILLGYRGTAGISARQCAITIDSELCLWLRDSSTYGTAVECDQQNRAEVRRKYEWILAQAPGTKRLFDDITVHVGALSFGVEFPNHEFPDAEYLENLEKIAALVNVAGQPEEASLIMGSLGLRSNTTTAAPSGMTTPRDQHIYYDRGIIGKGAFGEVRKVVEAHSGRLLAAKKFFPPNDCGDQDSAQYLWLRSIREEFDLMAKHPHVSEICTNM